MIHINSCKGVNKLLGYSGNYIFYCQNNIADNIINISNVYTFSTLSSLSGAISNN